MQELVAFVFVFINSIINVIIHTFGLYLLLATKIERSEKSVNHIYLVNLSAWLLFKNTVYILCSLLKIKIILDTSLNAENMYVYVIYMIPLVYSLCYVAMLVLIGDRIFLAFYGSNLYISSSWDRSHGKSLLFLLWVLIVVVFVVMYEVVGIFHGNIKIVSMYMVTLTNLVCIAFIVSILLVVHWILEKTKSKTRTTLREVLGVHRRNNVIAGLKQPNNHTNGPNGVGVDNYGFTLRHSPFYTTVLLSITFLILVVAPSLAMSVCSIVKGYVQEDLLIIVHICTTISDTANGLVYIFTYQSVLKMFVRRMRYIQGCCCFKGRSVHNSEIPRYSERKLTPNSEEKKVRSHDCRIILTSFANEYKMECEDFNQDEEVLSSGKYMENTCIEDKIRDGNLLHPDYDGKNGKTKSTRKQSTSSYIKEQFTISHTREEKNVIDNDGSTTSSNSSLNDRCSESEVCEMKHSPSSEFTGDARNEMFSLAYKDLQRKNNSARHSKKKHRLPPLKRKRVVPLAEAQSLNNSALH